MGRTPEISVPDLQRSTFKREPKVSPWGHRHGDRETHSKNGITATFGWDGNQEQFILITKEVRIMVETMEARPQLTGVDLIKARAQERNGGWSITRSAVEEARTRLEEDPNDQKSSELIEIFNNLSSEIQEGVLAGESKAMIDNFGQISRFPSSE